MLQPGHISFAEDGLLQETVIEEGEEMMVSTRNSNDLPIKLACFQDVPLPRRIIVSVADEFNIHRYALTCNDDMTCGNARCSLTVEPICSGKEGTGIYTQ